jgi:hypothetical protein
VQQILRVSYCRGKSDPLKLAARQASYSLQNREQMPTPVITGESMELIDNRYANLPKESERVGLS